MIVLPLTLGAMLLLLAGRFGHPGLVRLAGLRFHGGILALLACLAQWASVLAQRHRLLLLVLTAVLLLGFCWLNRATSGFWLMTIGIGLNLVVMLANGGQMPLSPSAFRRMGGLELASGTAVPFSKDRVLVDAAAALPWLGDRLLLPGPLARLAVWSIGDLLLLAGTGRLLWMTMKGRSDDQRNLRRGAAPC